MKKIIIAVSVLAAAFCMADTVTLRDSQGRLVGTKTTDSSGRITYRDAQGRLQGTSSTDSSGRTTYRKCVTVACCEAVERDSRAKRDSRRPREHQPSEFQTATFRQHFPLETPKS